MTPRLAALAFRHRSALLLLIVSPVVLHAVVGDRAPHLDEVAIGALACLGGVTLRLAAIRAIGKQARVHRAHTDTLVVSGPYAHVRNPLYLANSAVAGGLAVLAGCGLVSVAVVAASLALYALVVLHEEACLGGALGRAYAEYSSAVPRWMPRLTPAHVGIDPGPAWPWNEILWRERRLLLVPVVVLIELAVRTGLLPLHWGVRVVAQSVSLSCTTLLGGSLAAAALLNAASVECKLRRHTRARLALAAGPPPTEEA